MAPVTSQSPGSCPRSTPCIPRLCAAREKKQQLPSCFLATTSLQQYPSISPRYSPAVEGTNKGSRKGKDPLAVRATWSTGTYSSPSEWDWAGCLSRTGFLMRLPACPCPVWAGDTMRIAPCVILRCFCFQAEATGGSAEAWERTGEPRTGEHELNSSESQLRTPRRPAGLGRWPNSFANGGS